MSGTGRCDNSSSTRSCGLQNASVLVSAGANTCQQPWRDVWRCFGRTGSASIAVLASYCSGRWPHRRGGVGCCILSPPSATDSTERLARAIRLKWPRVYLVRSTWLKRVEITVLLENAVYSASQEELNLSQVIARLSDGIDPEIPHAKLIRLEDIESVEWSRPEDTDVVSRHAPHQYRHTASNDSLAAFWVYGHCKILTEQRAAVPPPPAPVMDARTLDESKSQFKTTKPEKRSGGCFPKRSIRRIKSTERRGRRATVVAGVFK